MDAPLKPEPAAPATTGKRRIPTGCIIAAAIVAVVVLALVGMHLYYRAKINAELDAVRKAGFPVTLREWSDYYPAPKGDNAAVIYAQAFAKFAGHDTPLEKKLPVVGMGKLPPRGEPLPDEVKTDISAYLAANAQALELLHKAATIEGCRFDLDFSRGNDMLLPHLAELRQAGRLLELQALMKVEGGKPDEAARAIADSFGAARALLKEPLLISQLVRMAVISLSVSGLERVLSRTALGDQQLTDLSKAIALQENPEGLMRGLAGERCIGEDVYLSNFSRYAEADYKPGADALFFWNWSGLKAMDQLAYLRMMAGMVKAAGGSAKEMRDQPAECEREIKQASKVYLLTWSLAPALLRVNEEQLRMLAHLRTARAAVAVERFRAANGRLPDSLDELMPKWLDTVPADPFSDKPIRYRKLSKGFMTDSVGPEEDRDRIWAHDQVSFIVAR